MTSRQQLEQEKKNFIRENQEKFYKIFNNVCKMRVAEIKKQKEAVNKTIKKINKEINKLESTTKNMKSINNRYEIPKEIKDELKSLKKLKIGKRLVLENNLNTDNIIRKKIIENNTFQDLRIKKNEHQKKKKIMFEELEKIRGNYESILFKYNKILKLTDNKTFLHWFMLGNKIFTNFKREFPLCKEYLKYTHSSRSNFEELYEYLRASTERTQKEINQNGGGRKTKKKLKKSIKKINQSSKKVKRNIHTGPKGGKYYIKNGKKVYM